MENHETLIAAHTHVAVKTEEGSIKFKRVAHSVPVASITSDIQDLRDEVIKLRELIERLSYRDGDSGDPYAIRVISV